MGRTTLSSRWPGELRASIVQTRMFSLLAIPQREIRGEMTIKKPKSKAKLKTAVWDIFSKYIRMRDCLGTTGSVAYGECFTCDEPPQHEFKDLDAGHFISGRHNANLFSEKGCHAQCRRCNRFLHGNQLEYRRQIIRLYGKGYDEILEAEARRIKKFTVVELEDIKKYYTEKIKEMEVS